MFGMKNVNVLTQKDKNPVLSMVLRSVGGFVSKVVERLVCIFVRKTI